METGEDNKTVAGRWCGQGAASTRLPCTPEDIPIGVRWLCLVEAVVPKNHLEDVGVVGVLRVVEVGEPHPWARALVDGTGLPDGAKLAQELVAKYDAPVAILVHGDGDAVGGGALGSRGWALLAWRGSHGFARWVENHANAPLRCLPCEGLTDGGHDAQAVAALAGRGGCQTRRQRWQRCRRRGRRGPAAPAPSRPSTIGFNDMPS